jgi:hypothetical protein
MIQVAIVNHSTGIADIEMQPMVRALQHQVGKDFYPAWGINAILTHIYPPAKPPATSWVIGLFDDADQADALGYHDVTPAGLPLAKVFVRTTRANGASVSVVASHELLEMLADPWINVWIMDAINPSRFWIREVCDPVEADADGYHIDIVLVSNFVLPSYFQPDLKLKPPFDFLHELTKPIPALRSGGYLSYVENGQVGQIFGADHRPSPSKIGGSGRITRAVRRLSGDWKTSTFSVEAT